MATCTGSLVQLCCEEGGTLQTTLLRWGVPSADWFATAQGGMYSQSTLLRLRAAPQQHCPRRAPCLMPLPGLSCSGSLVLCRGIDQMGCACCALPWSKHSGKQVLCEHTAPAGLCILCPSLVLAARFPRCAVGLPQAVTLLVDVHHPGS